MASKDIEIVLHKIERLESVLLDLACCHENENQEITVLDIKKALRKNKVID